ncbi:kinesin-like protein [Volvox carteri f. nagariensis]|uniref:Kinesin-like protein n=1 Tax=Volvox carteri f. nagariensis TaxID=3068 RepID=D8U691_VOLCA|nr:kinesin-like protein [Volvox carteri f. nagariensis]EFJ44812.1 kinesin-like protein [Volvox carteri f. nagariensis]|eukprot:XP_002954095.1 kinesin-like protein [Volvox carteri f. nagariensis]
MQASDDTSEQPNRIQVVVRVRPVLPHELTDEVAVTCSPDARKLQAGRRYSAAIAFISFECRRLVSTGPRQLKPSDTPPDGVLPGAVSEGRKGGYTGGAEEVLLPDRLTGGTNLLPGATRSGARSYEFDACLPGNTTQDELYDTCGLQELVEAALDGYCVTVFAFGQTGSGKTHTIIGPRLSRGAAAAAAAAAAASGGTTSATATGCLPPAAVVTAAAYRSIEARSAVSEFSVTASVVELYNEAVTDLLALDKNKPLQVRKDSRDGFAVTGLTQVSCPTDVSAVRYMVRALQYRHTRGHKLNEYSSRSHCLMTFVFASKERGPEGQMGAKGGVRRYGKLALVDLAGSERLKDTGNNEKGAVRETGAINKSLFTLGQVLGALSARSCGNPAAFVPFRDSKLTQLLWDGLRGSGRCLMLACLSPLRSAAEESLNTLHFATIATRIKAEPVVLLDPQDQLVLDLRKTINQLREENRQLAGALQQLSLGADASAVLATLPEPLRAHAAGSAGGSGGGSAAGSGTASPVTPDQPTTPSTPQRQLQTQQLQPQQQLQPSASAGGRGRQPFESAVAEAAAAVGNVVTTPPPPPPPAPASQQQPQQQQLQQQQAPLLQSVAEVPSPSYSAPPATSRTRGKQNGRPVAAQAAYGMPDGAGRNGRKPGAPGNKGSSPRSKSVGRGGGGGGGGRPTYLTEDPAALLFGYSSALQPPPPLPPPGSGSSSTMSLPVLVPTRGAPGVVPPPPAMAEFPELAAMEAEFQSMLGNGGAGGGAPSAAAPPQQRRAPPGSGQSAGAGGSSAAAAVAAVEAEVEDSGATRPDVRALKWAERNAWFGTDYDMTSYAYQVHDQLVDVESVDPTSDLYYMEIERRVAEKFPERWAKSMKDQLPGGSGAAAVAAVRRAVPSPNRPRPGDPPRSSPPPSYSAALRVNIKDPLVAVRSGSGGSRDVAASLAAQAAAVRARQQQQQPQGSASYDSMSYESYGEASQPETLLYGVAVGMGAGISGSEPSTPPMQGVNPFNVGALHALAPPKASKLAHLPAAGQGLVLVPAGAEQGGGAVRGSTTMEVLADPNAAERIQREYARQRAIVVEELRKAKEDAEAERQRILARIQRAAGGNKWR